MGAMPVGHRRGDASQPVGQRGQLSCLDTAVIPMRLAVSGRPRRRARWRPAMISASGVNCGSFTVAGDGSWLGVIEPAEQLFL